MGTIKMLKRPDVSELAGEKVMIDFETGKYFMLKGSANDIWELLEDGITAEQIVEKLLDVYEVDKATCENSVHEFLNTLVSNGFISVA